jgi:hypothetical protein
LRAASVISKGYSGATSSTIATEPYWSSSLTGTWQNARAREERARLEAVRAGMTVLDLRGVVEATNTLKRMQREPDPLEALATIPTLSLSIFRAPTSSSRAR